MKWVLSRRCHGHRHALTVNVSSGSCMVMQSMLIWMVFPAEPSLGLSVKFSSMGWTEWMADLKGERDFLKTWNVHFALENLPPSTYWSSISKSWLNTSWLKESDVCDDWLWDVVARNELSLQDRRDAGSLSLHTRGKTAAVMLASWLASKFSLCFNKHFWRDAMWANTRRSRWWEDRNDVATQSGGGGGVLHGGGGGRYHCEEVLHNAEYLYYP